MDNNFKPVDLCYGIVNALFNSCLKTSDSTSFIQVNLYTQKRGYPEDSEPVYFDADAIQKFEKKITYIFGQLKLAHLDAPIIGGSIQDFLEKYNDQYWATDGVTLLKLLHLGMANNNISPFYAKTDTAVLSTELIPTLSPKDPNFKEWYEQNKSKILKKKGGQEPADD